MKVCKRCGKQRPNTWYLRRADGQLTDWCCKCRGPVWVKKNTKPPKCGTATVESIVTEVLASSPRRL